MNYSDLDSIIDYFKSTSSYYLIKKPNNITLKTLIKYTIAVEIVLLIIVKLLNIDFLTLPLLIIASSIVSFFLSAFFLIRKINKKINNYIKDYNIMHSLNLKKYDQVRLDIFYHYLLDNTGCLSDENFNLLITYAKNQEDILNGDPSYNAKKTLLINSILAFIVSASSALTTKFITNNSQLIIFILTSSFIIGIIYTFFTSIIDFPNKMSDEKDTYKYLKSFLYKAKFRYNIEYPKENLNNTDTKASLKNSKENVANLSIYENNFKNSTKTKLHKVIDLLFE
ncbi:uncharacterized protein YneF (UPF0154 family) [Clostridium beijerinckii]|uniref:hypothetical protein n=1 Tax=Clostridium beijerinckii TaxID=1520 RepID=UPI00156F87BB|nr:hypothetical protein [Clostridium beijerinckii]NRT33998.1 uncharacterized protein YneF (UPF0154 family) [Clostridium beijerinckii]NRT46572.1 uncharacterized protein YneF (UPF0154 family) [Clostridium beijerinckii]NRZ19423.1 uncharacterized protein YneF (UPF0154 family) [Clostridium beijerinckii]